MESKMFIVIGVGDMIIVKTDSAQEAKRIAVENGYIKDWDVGFIDATDCIDIVEAKWNKDGVFEICKREDKTLKEVNDD